MSKSLKLAKSYLNKIVEVTVDRPLGSKHPKHGFEYLANYGFLKGEKAPDGEDLDAYVIGITNPLESFTGRCIAIVHRLQDDDDKLIVVPEGMELTDDEIERAVEFQEKWFEHKIVGLKSFKTCGQCIC